MIRQNVPPVNQQPGHKVWLRRLITGLLVTALPMWGILSSLVQPVMALPKKAAFSALAANIVISEFRFTGSGGGTDEFVEIFNPTVASIDISGWKIRGSNNAGTVGDRYTFPIGSVLQSGRHYLIRGSGFDDGVTADGTLSAGITADGGVAITLSNNSVIDAVGLSALAASAFGSTSPLVTPQIPADVDQSYERKPGGGFGSCEDGDIASDFQLITSTPQNLASPATPCPPPSPTPVGARRVLINEIAWGGTQADGSMGQWIELYNPDGIDLTGWHLIAADGSPDIPLAGTTPASGYFLLARRSDVFQPPLAVQQVFSDVLSSTGESLSLYTSSGELVDTANSNGGSWPAGTGFVPYRSMERNGANPDTDAIWISFAGIPTVQDRNGNPINGSPGQVNWSDGMAQPTPTSTATATVTSTTTVTPTTTITLTRTITATTTVTSTRTITPTKTLTPINSPTRTQTATRTATRTPTATPRMDVLINEVGWAGTKDSTHPGNGANAEWIELYNPSTAPVLLAGWKLKIPGYSDILLSGTIPAQGYYLLERGNDDVISNIPADLIYSGILSDSGTSLSLWDNNSVLVDTANGNGGGWPAGNATNKCSMERASASSPDTDVTWVTPPITTQVGKDASGDWVCGTPKNANWAYSVTLTPSPTLTSTRTPTRTRTLTPTKTPTLRKSLTPTRTRTPTPNRATPEPIILNEFLVQPKTDYNGDGKVDFGDQFIELKNLSTNSISISGYRLDDQDGDSLPYTIQNVTMQPQSRMAFFASQTGIRLSMGGDSVRLYKSSGSLPADAFTYGVIKIPNQSWCRLPDNNTQYFAIKWVFGCEPTPNEVNKLVESVFIGNHVEAAICLSKSLPFPVYQAECDPLGLEMWSQALWDESPHDFPRFFEMDAQEFIIE